MSAFWKNILYVKQLCSCAIYNSKTFCNLKWLLLLTVMTDKKKYDEWTSDTIVKMVWWNLYVIKHIFIHIVRINIKWDKINRFLIEIKKTQYLILQSLKIKRIFFLLNKLYPKIYFMNYLKTVFEFSFDLVYSNNLIYLYINILSD